MSRSYFSYLLLAAWCLLASTTVLAQEKKTTNAPKEPNASKEEGWKSLIVAKSLEGWEKSNYGGEGNVSVAENGELIFDSGMPLTGITYKKEFPKENFEVRWKAKRIEGSDFLAGLTFPVGDEHCSFICGGWGGGLVGISSIDGNDASENQTTQFLDVKNNQWYSFVVKVTPKTIQVWIDGKEVIDLPREGKSFTVRGEVRINRPFGYCVFSSKVAVKDFEYRLVK
ncbi:MAG: DUF1080 domain-containing protein [Pirellulales bacterium]